MNNTLLLCKALRRQTNAVSKKDISREHCITALNRLVEQKEKIITILNLNFQEELEQLYKIIPKDASRNKNILSNIFKSKKFSVQFYSYICKLSAVVNLEAEYSQRLNNTLEYVEIDYEVEPGLYN